MPTIPTGLSQSANTEETVLRRIPAELLAEARRSLPAENEVEREGEGQVEPAGPGAPGLPPGSNAPGLNAPGLIQPGLNAPGLNAPGLNAPGLAEAEPSSPRSEPPVPSEPRSLGTK